MSSPRLEVHLLGELEVARAGRPLALPASRKTRALFAYLVASRSPQPRARLCELLWEGPVDPRAALRWSLTKLRPAVDDAAGKRLRADRERVSFDATAVDIDLFAVESALGGGLAAASTAVLAAAAARFRGEFLEGLDLPDCYRFQEWLRAHREAVHALHSGVLAALVERRDVTPSAALRHARAWVALDPLDEAAQAAVVRLLGAAGHPREALAQYESCRRMLAVELGTGPSAVLEDARRSLQLGPAARSSRALGAVRAGAAPAPLLPPPSPPRPSAPRAAWPRLVGRGSELADALAMLDGAAAGRSGPVLLVLGEPGIGKSRLLAEVVAAARQRGGAGLYGRAFETEAVNPYGAWIDALRSASLPVLTDPGPAAAALRSALAPLLVELGPAPPEPGDRGRLFDAVRRLLAGVAGVAGLAGLGGERGEGSAAPVVVAIDDLQWIDEASAGLLHYLARQAAPPLLLACAARQGELADSPAALRLVRSLGREGALRRLELGPLDQAETAELAFSVTPGAAAADVEKVFAESRGNPLFALEVAAALASGEGALAGSLGGMIRDRLARLGSPARDLLPWAAALGREFAADRLTGVTGMPPADLISGLAELERHGILRAATTGPEAFDFGHDLIRQAAYQQVSAPRRRLVHRQIARSLAALPDTGGALAGEVCRHADLGGESELAATAAVAAGERCLRLFASAEAVELAERGLRQVQGLPQPLRLRLQMDLLRIYVHASLGRRRGDELEGELQRLVAEAEAAGLHPQVQVGLYLLSVLSEERGKPTRARAYSIRAADAGREADPLTAARALANTGRCLAQLERDHSRAAALLREAEVRMRGLGREIVDVPWGLGLTRLFAGDAAGAASSLNEALDVARGLQDHWASFECLARLVMIDLEAGRPDQALGRSGELGSVAAKLGEGSEVPVAETLIALACFMAGEGAAGERLERALAELHRIDTKGLLAYAQNLAAELDLAAGRPEAARRRAEEALQAAAIVDRPTQVVLARALLGRLDLLAGERGAAGAHLAAATAAAADVDRVSVRARRAVRELLEKEARP
jgi:DNA-binding SARP family transcriptional activator/tetratricopeptide (TPR) repeat protein